MMLKKTYTMLQQWPIRPSKALVIPSYEITPPYVMFHDVAIMYIPWKGATQTVLYSHGRDVDLGKVKDTLIAIQNLLKVNICSYDYSGYGMTRGEVSIENMIKCATTCFDYLMHEILIRPEQVILVGEGIGTIPTIHLGSTNDCFAVVLLNTYEATGFFGIFPWLFQWVDYNSQITMVKPKLFIECQRGNGVHAMKLFEKAPNRGGIYLRDESDKSVMNEMLAHDLMCGRTTGQISKHKNTTIAEKNTVEQSVTSNFEIFGQEEPIRSKI